MCDLITLDLLYNITNEPVTKDQLSVFVEPLKETCNRYAINTPLRVVHFLAQVCHESDGMNTTREYADGSAYEYRDDLGNVNPGDGVRYAGRGLIQVTGRYNYEEISKDLGIDYVSDPGRLEALPDAVISAGWYWDKRNLNALADEDDLWAITEAINGGTNGLDCRMAYLHKAKKQLGL